MGRQRWIIPAMLLAAVVVCACSGGGTGTNVASSRPDALLQTVALVLVLPDSAPAGLRRSPLYVPPNAASISVAITAAGNTTTSTLNVTSSTCPVVNGSTTCTFTLAAPIGNDTFTVSIFDGGNGTGNLLAAGTIAATIVQNATNTVNITLQPVATPAPRPTSTPTPGNLAFSNTTTDTLSSGDPNYNAPTLNLTPASNPVNVLVTEANYAGTFAVALDPVTCGTGAQAVTIVSTTDHLTFTFSPNQPGLCRATVTSSNASATLWIANASTSIGVQ